MKPPALIYAYAEDCAVWGQWLFGLDERAGFLNTASFAPCACRTFRQDIADLIRTTYRGKSGIVYCFSKQDCENMNETLRLADISAAYYHAALNSEVCIVIALCVSSTGN